MKNLKILSLVIVFIFSYSCKGNDKDIDGNPLATKANSEKTRLKRYKVKSGIVKYKTTIKGKMMGSTVEGDGTEELYFKDWGAVELKKTDSKQVTHVNIFGHKKTEVNETHQINKLDNGKAYSVDVKNKIIYVRNDPAMEMIKNTNNGDVTEVSEKMLESIGGKKIGKEKVLGYNCDVWEVMGGKQWIYKGVPLKFEMSMMGITTTTTATDAKFNINVPDKYFQLPDYPVQEMQMMGGMSDEDQEDMKKSAQMMKKMSFEEYKAMMKKQDPESFKNMSDKDLKMSYDLMQKMAEQMGN